MSKTHLVPQLCRKHRRNRPCGRWSWFPPCWGPQRRSQVGRFRLHESRRWIRKPRLVHRAPSLRLRPWPSGRRGPSADRRWIGTESLKTHSPIHQTLSRTLPESYPEYGSPCTSRKLCGRPALSAQSARRTVRPWLRWSRRLRWRLRGMLRGRSVRRKWCLQRKGLLLVRIINC